MLTSGSPFPGLLHEHQRPDRDEYVTFVPENLIQKCPAGTKIPKDFNCGWLPQDIPDGCCPDLKDFEPWQKITNYDWSGKYDYESIMHYYSTTDSISNTLSTLVSKKNPKGNGEIQPGGAQLVSPYDGGKLCKVYGTICGTYNDCVAAGCPATGCNASTQQCADKKKKCTDLDCDFVFGI